MRDAIHSLQNHLQDSRKRKEEILEKMMAHVKRLDKLEKVIDQHRTLSTLRKENLNRFQRRLIEVGIRAIALELFELISMRKDAAGGKSFVKIKKLVTQIGGVLEVSIRRLQCELLLSELGEKTDLPEWTRAYFHMQDNKSMQSLVSGCMEQGFWTRVLHKANGLSNFELQADFKNDEEVDFSRSRQKSKKGPLSRSDSSGLKPERLSSPTTSAMKRSSLFEAKLMDDRGKRVTLSMQTLMERGLKPHDMDDDEVRSVYGLQPEKTADFHRTFKHRCERYWELFHDLIAVYSTRSLQDFFLSLPK